MKVTPNRVVVVLTPVFVGVSGWLVGWVADNFPGHPQLNSGEVTVLMIAGALAAFGAVVKWLHGWQKHEDRIASPEVVGDGGVSKAVTVKLRRKRSAK